MISLFSQEISADQSIVSVSPEDRRCLFPKVQTLRQLRLRVCRCLSRRGIWSVMTTTPGEGEVFQLIQSVVSRVFNQTKAYIFSFLHVLMFYLGCSSRFRRCVRIALSWNTTKMKIQVQISWVGQSTRVVGACLNAKTALLPNLLVASPGKCSGTLSTSETLCWDELQHQLVLESSIIILLAIVAQVFAKQRFSYVWSLGGGAVQQAPRWGNLVIIV